MDWIRFGAWALPCLYLVAAGFYGWLFFRKSGRTRATTVLCGVTLAHAGWILAIGLEHGRIPLASLSEGLSAIACAIAVVYLLLELSDRRSAPVGLLLLPILLALVTLSAALYAPRGAVHPVLESPYFGVHAGLAILACAAFGISATYGICHVILYRQLRAGTFGILYDRMPSLLGLARLNYRAALSGWLLMTAAIVTGAFWASGRFEQFYLDPKVVGTGLAWGIYAVLIADRYFRGTEGRRTAWVSLAGFTCLVLVFVAGLLGSFHNF